jgi:signal transduction histidine kinase
MSSHCSEPVYSHGDKSRIKQILVNLLDNAIKYSRQGGHIVTSVKAEGNTAVLTVSDDGVGIPADALPHVFDRFYRAEKARTRGTAGAGLGLSIVQAICRAHGGTVSVTSTEGKGTSVQVRLPGADLASAPVAQEQQAMIR